MSLRAACQVAAAPTPLEIRWKQLALTAGRIARRWADRPERKPPAFQLDTIVDSVRRTWKADRSLAGLSNRESRWLPHAIFHPEAKRDAWLAQDPAFVAAALSVIRQRSRTLRSLLRNVIRLWPKELATAGDIQRMLTAELRAAVSPRLQEWAGRVERYGLLSVEGPRRVAALLYAEPKRRAGLLEDAGLAGDLAQSGFVVEVHRRVADVLTRHLTTARYHELESGLELLAPERQLAFRAEAPYVADALLLPFCQTSPPPAVQETIRTFLLRHLDDPRSTQSGWTRVKPAAKDVMLRWMVGATLEDFFALIARRAQEEHWRYRQAFWNAYLKGQYISRAWVVLGDNARQEAIRRWRDAVPAHGQLSGGDPDQCVLLLQVGSLTFVEWSHNGACRAWQQGNKDCPPLYDRRYSRERLLSNPNHERRHAGNLSYTWQQKLAEFIRQETGISISQDRYRVR